MERIVNDVVLRSIDGVEFREDVKLRQRTGTADRKLRRRLETSS